MVTFTMGAGSAHTTVAKDLRVAPFHKCLTNLARVWQWPDWEVGIRELLRSQASRCRQTVTRLIFILSLTPFWMSTACNHRRWRP